MMSVDELRTRIDAVDDELLDLLEKRAKLVQQVGEIKRNEARAYHDPERETLILNRLEARQRSREQAAFPGGSVRPVFREIISACLSLEEPQRIAFLGPPGAFTHMAALSAFGLAAQYVEATTIAGVFDAVQRHSAAFGVVPIENSTEGGVSFTLECLFENNLQIRRELVLGISHCLMAQHQDLSRIQRVYSHPQALAQCRSWLAKNLPGAQLVVSTSTSAAARQVLSDPEAAAIASRLAAELNGLSVVVENVQDREQNATRFIVLAEHDAPATGDDKTSIVFSTPHQRGALRKVLEIFDEAGINLSRIESRPHGGKLWEYDFFTDIEGHRQDEHVARALELLRQNSGSVKILGSYPRHR